MRYLAVFLNSEFDMIYENVLMLSDNLEEVFDFTKRCINETIEEIKEMNDPELLEGLDLSEEGQEYYIYRFEEGEKRPSAKAYINENTELKDIKFNDRW